MAARFWVGGSGNWDAASTTNWAATSGGAPGASVPTAADTVTFDANSGAAATATVTVPAVCSSLTINKADLTLLLNSTLTVSGQITLTTGTFNTNGSAVSATKFVSSNTNARTLTLGNTTMTLTANSSINWDTSTPTNMVMTANTGTVLYSGATAIHNSSTLDHNGMSITFTGGGASNLLSTTGTVGIRHLTYTGTASQANTLTINGAALTLSGGFTVTCPDALNRVLVQSATVGTTCTVSAAWASLTNADFQDIGGVATATARFSAEVLTDLPTHFFKLWDGSGVVAVDSSGNGRDGTYNAAPTLHAASPLDIDPSAFGVTLNGSSQYISRPSEASLHPNAPWSYEMVFTVNGGAGTFRALASIRDEGTNAGWLLYLNDVNKLDLRHGGGGTQILSDTTYAVGQKLHVVIGHDGTKFFMYVNGAKQTQNPTAAYVAPTTTDLNIGRRLDNSFFAPITVQHCSLYNSALSGARILTHYNALFAVPAGTFSGTTLGNAQGNSGITFTAPTTQSWVGTAGGNWSDVTKWTSRVPLPQDNVVIAAAFVAAQTINPDTPRLGKDIDLSGMTGNPLVTSSSRIIYGNLKLGAGYTWGPIGSLFGTWTLAGRGSQTITSGGNNCGVCLQINCATGVYTLADDLHVTTNTGPELKAQAGTFDAGGFNVTMHSLFQNGSEHGTILMRSGTWSLSPGGSATVWQVSSLTITPGTATIDIVDTSSGTKFFTGGGLSYGTLRYRSVATGGVLSIFSNNTFANLDVETNGSARTLSLPGLGTQTVTGTLTLQGASGQVLTVNSSTPGQATTIIANTTRAINAFVTASADVRMAPLIDTNPVISGTPVVGSVLSTTDGTWTGYPAPGAFTYQWMRGVATIGGATANTYTLVDADDGQNVRCVVTATNSSGSSTGTSNALAITEPVPTNTVAPTVSGAPTVGSTLTCANGTWTHMGGSIATFGYQWTRDGVNIGGATSQTYMTVVGDVGHAIGCKVVATNTGGPSAAQASSNTIGITQAPANTAAPVVSGTAKVGSILSTTDGTWTGTPAPTFTYQWLRVAPPSPPHLPQTIVGANSPTYTLVDADDGFEVYCQVTATNTAGAASATSNRLAITEPVPVNTVPPVVSGTAPVGSVLSVTDGTWSHMGGSVHTFAYQWTRDGADIGGANAATYITVLADVSHAVACKVTATNSGGASAPQASNSITVTEPPVDVELPTIFGRPAPGSTISCTPGTWDEFPLDPLVFAFQWEVSTDGISWADIAGETDPFYAVTNADMRKHFRCTVTATNTVGSTDATSAPVGPVSRPWSLATDTLGCGTYDVYVLSRGGATLVAVFPWTSLSWERVLDDTSQASALANGYPSGCCTALKNIRAWRHEIAIYRDGDLIWVGPVFVPKAPPQQFSIEARDVTAWWDHRRIHDDHIYDVPTDLATIFKDISDDAMAPDPSPGLHVVPTPCGVESTLSLLGVQHLMAAQKLRDITTTGIDWTTVARDVLVGGSVVPTASIGTFRDEHFSVPPTPKIDGSAQANSWLVRGSGTGVAGDTIYGLATDPTAADDDGLLESVATVSTLQDNDSALAAAQSRTALTSSPLTIENCVLSPEAPFTIDQLVPGALCELALEQTCIPVFGPFRLQKVSGKAEGQGETITVTFQPVGTE